MYFEQLEQKALAWAEERNILSDSDAKSQFIKCVSEIGELADAVNNDDLPEYLGAMGDVLVTLILLNHFMLKDAGDYSKADLSLSLLTAYNEIKDRKARLLTEYLLK